MKMAEVIEKICMLFIIEKQAVIIKSKKKCIKKCSISK
jgi:hypothetical protein